MESQNLRQTLISYGQLFKRLRKQRRLIGAVTLGGALLSVLIAYSIPRVYRSSTLILIQQQKVPSSYVQSAISVDLGERLRTLTPQIMSRSKLEAIIRKFGLYEGGNNPKEMEKKVDRMRDAIDVQVKGEDTFRIYFDYASPDVARRGAEELATLFIEENLKDRAQQAMSTSEFLDSELLNLKSQLEDQEGALRSFKERHLGVLPEQQNANLKALDRFQSQYQANGEALAAARERKAGIETRISKETSDGLFVIPTEPQLDKLRGELAEKRAQFTDKHPDVRTLARKIDEMERKLMEFKSTGGEGSEKMDPYTRGVAEKLDQVNREIAQLEAEQQAVTENIAGYQKRIESLPGVEEKLTLLTRDYETTRANYQSLLNKKFEARLSMNLEKKQRDDAFKVLDPAFLPASAVKPRRSLIMLAGFFLSLVLGLGTGFVVESFDTRIRDENDLRAFAPAPVISIIPHLERKDPEVSEFIESGARGS